MEKLGENPESVPEAQDIEFRYLELDTALPTPCITLPPGPTQSPPPEAPSLEKYTSPFLWPKWRKSMMTYIACAVTALAGYAAGEGSPASEELTKLWGISTVVYNLNITLFCCGFALAPMVLAPFSEINGRRPIFIASGILFVGMYTVLHDMLDLYSRFHSLFDRMWRDRIFWWIACSPFLSGRGWVYVYLKTNDSMPSIRSSKKDC